VLHALGIPDDFVDRFLQARRGPDALDGTADDPQMDDPTARALLGLTNAQSQPGQPGGVQTVIAPFKSSNVFRIVSVGKSGEVTRSVEMIVLKQVVSGGAPVGSATVLGVGQPRVFSWKEL